MTSAPLSLISFATNNEDLILCIYAYTAHLSDCPFFGHGIQYQLRATAEISM